MTSESTPLQATPPSSSPQGWAASRRSVAALLLLTIATVAGIIDHLPWQPFPLSEAPWISIPGAILGGLALLTAPENRPHRRRMAGLVGLGIVFAWIGGLMALQGVGNPQPSRLVRLLTASAQFVSSLGLTFTLAAVILGLVPLARQHLPGSLPWILVPVAVIWLASLVVDHFLVGILGLVSHPDFYPTGYVLIRLTLAAGLVPLVTLLGAMRER